MADLTPDKALEQGAHLYESYCKETKKKSPAQQDVRVQELFLVRTGEQLEFVKKSSFKGVWKQVVHGLCQLVGKEGPLDVQKNLQLAQRIFTKAQETKPTETEKRNLNQLASELITLQSELPETKKHKIELNPPFRGISKEVVQQALKPEEAQDLFDALSDLIEGAFGKDIFTPRELKLIQAVIMQHQERDELVSDLNKSPPNLARLQSALGQVKSTSSSKAELSSVLSKINPERSPSQTQEYSTTFSELEGVFGESSDLDTLKCRELVARFVKENPQYKERLEPVLKAVVLGSKKDEIEVRSQLVEHQIRSQLETNGKCFLRTQEMYYELTLEKNGTLTLAAYNQTDPDLPNALVDPYKTERQAAIELSGIKMDDFFKPTLLKSFVLDGNEEVMNMLGGTRVPLSKTTQKLLSSTRSGSLAQRSQMAALSHTMPASEFRKFKCELKLFVLKRFREELEQQTSTMTLGKACFAHRAGMRAVQQFSASLNKLQFVLPEDMQQAIQSECKSLELVLDRLDAHIAKLEHQEKKLMPLPVQSEPQAIEEVEPPYTHSLNQRVEKKPQGEVALVSVDTLQGEIMMLSINYPDKLKDWIIRFNACSATAEQKLLLTKRLLDKIGGFMWLQYIRLDDEIIQEFVQNAEDALKARITEISPQNSKAIIACMNSLKELPITGKQRRLIDDALFTKVGGLEGLKKLGPVQDFMTCEVVIRAEIKQLDPKDSKAILACISHINKGSFLPEERLLLTEALFQKIGGLKGIEALTYTPEEAKTAVEVFSDFMNKAADAVDIDTYVAATDARRYLTVLLGTRALERAFSFVDTKGRIFGADTPSILGRVPDRNLKELVTTDPFWAEQLVLIKERAESDRESDFYSIWNAHSVAMTLTDSMAKAIVAWVDQNPEFKRKVDELWVESEQKKNQTLASLSPIARLLEEQKATYFPPGFSDLPPREYATALLTHAFKAFPPEFQSFIQSTVLSASIFSKSNSKKPVDIVPVAAKTDDGKIGLFFKDQGNTLAPYSNQGHDPISYSLDGSLLNETYNRGIQTDVEEGRVAIVATAKSEHANTLNDLEEAREYMQLHAVRGVRIESMINYCNEHPDFLQTESGRAIFSALMFESDVLLQEIANPNARKICAKQLQEFFKKQISSMVQLDNYREASSMVFLANKLQRYFDHAAGKKDEPRLVATKTWLDLLEKVVGPKYAEQRQSVYAYLLAGYDVGSQIPENEEEKKLLAYMLLLRPFRDQLTSEQADILLLPDIEKNTLLLDRFTETYPDQKALADLINSASSYIGSVFTRLKGLHFAPKGAGVFEGSIDERACIELDLASHTITAKADPTLLQASSEAVCSKHAKILKNHNFTWNKEHFFKLRSMKSNKDTFISDPIRNCDIRIATYVTEVDERKVHKNEVWLKLPQSEWARVLDSSQAAEVLGNVELGRKCIVLQKEKGLELIDPKTLEVLYKAEDGMLMSVESPLRFLAKAPENSPFSVFESKNCTSYWQNQDEVLTRIDCSRLGVSFVRENTVWKLASDTAWRVAEEQTLDRFGDKTGFIVLENSKGQKKALLPVREVGSDGRYIFSEDDLHVRYVECDIVQEKLVPKTLEARYQLARVYLQKEMVDEAESLLFSPLAEKTTASLTDSERAILEACVMWKEAAHVPRAHRIQMRALLLLVKDNAQFPSKEGDGKNYLNHETLEPILKAYFRKASRTPQLPIQDELFLLEKIQPHLQEMQKVCAIRSLELGGEPLACPFEDARIQPSFFVKLLAKAAPILLPIGKKILALRNVKETRKEFDKILEAKRPTSRDKLRYTVFRLQKRFPFDETNPGPDDLKRYRDLLLQECRGSLWNSGVRSGLVPFLHHLAHFHSDEKCRELGAGLLALIPTVEQASAVLGEPVQKEVEALNRANRLTKTSVPQTLLPAFHALQRGAQELLSIGYIKASAKASTFLPKIFNEHLKKEKQVVEPSEASTGIYKNNLVGREDPALKGELERADIDLQQAKLEKEEFSLLDTKDVASIGDEIRPELARQEETLQDLEMYLVGSINAALFASPVTNNQFTAKLRPYPTIEEICFIAARKDFERIFAKRYPELAKEDLQKIRAAVKEYLQQKQYVQQLRRANSFIDISTLNQLGSALQQKRAYSLDDENALIYLALETSQNFIMREDQVANIREFQKALKENRAQALQMIMGAGKSSVLQPVLAILLADSQSLSAVLVPDALFEQVRVQLVDAIGSAFEQYILYMPYSRDLAQDASYLNTFYNRLIAAQEQGVTMLFTPRQKHSIITSMYEAYKEQKRVGVGKDKALDARLDTICKIVAHLQKNEVVQMDEIDTIMNPEVTFKYPVGDRSIIHAERAKLVTELVLEIAKDPRFRSVDFAARFQARAGILPSLHAKELSEAEVKAELVTIAQRLLGKENDTYIAHFLAQSTPHDEAVEYAKSPKERKDAEELQLAFRKEMIEHIRQEIPDPDERNRIGVLSKVINNVLTKSLYKKCGMHYGSSERKGDFLACPYEASDSPKPTVFSDPYEQLVYALQNTLYTGGSLDMTKAVLAKMRKDAAEEMKSSLCQLADTAAFKRFEHIMGDAAAFSFTEVPPSERLLQAVQEKLNADPEQIKIVASEQLFGQISVYTESISSTAHTIAGATKVSGGYTGTLQPSILPQGMEAKPVLGTDGKTILAVQNKITAGTSAIARLAKNDGPLLDQVLERFSQDKDLFVFIDSGGWLKDERIEQYAERMLDAVKDRGIEAICYIASDRSKMSLERDASGKLVHVALERSKFKTSEGKHVTIMAQKFETGIDIPQKPTAKAFISVRKNMTMRDMLQSIFRMRQILAGQNVILGLSEEVQAHIKSQILDGLFANENFLSQDFSEIPPELTSAVQNAHEAARHHLPNRKEYIEAFKTNFAYTETSDDLWRYLSICQGESVKKKNWLAVQGRMREVVERPIRELLADVNLPSKTRARLFDKMEQLVVQGMQDEPFEVMATLETEVDAKIAVDRQVARLKKLYMHMQSDPELKHLLPKTLETIEAELRDCVHFNEIPKTLPASGTEQNQELEVEAEKETETEKEVEVELPEVRVRGVAPVATYKKDFLNRLMPIASILPKGIRLPNLSFSPNLFPGAHTIGTNNHALNRLPECFLLETKPGQFVMISLKDAEELKKQDPIPYTIYSLDAKPSVYATETPPQASDALKRAAVQAKLCMGKVGFSKDEIKTLQTIISEQKDPKAYAKNLQRLLEGNIRYLRRTREDYKGSAIQQMFLTY